jgi:hypothetical protein
MVHECPPVHRTYAHFRKSIAAPPDADRGYSPNKKSDDVAEISLFAPTTLGALALRNRIVMVPMTRSRALEASTPNDLMAEYYGQRGSVA